MQRLPKLRGHCFWFTVALAVALHATSATFSFARQLNVPIIERSNGTLDTCGFGKVAGLNPMGDGFLAVRSGPSASFSKLDEIYNHDHVWIFERRGNWIGIVYGVSSLQCSPVFEDRILNKKGKRGWVHGKWIRLVAG